MTDWGDDALSGLDRPRELPPELRRRLEHAMASGEPGGPEPPVGDEASSRTEGASAERVAAALAGADAPRPLPPATRARMEHALRAARRAPRLVGAAAAAVVVGAGVTAGLLSGGGGPPATPTQAARSPRPVAPGAIGRAGPRAAVPSEAGAGVLNTPSAIASPAATLPAPYVGGLDPASGPQRGGTWVVVTGSGFEGVTAVSFGAVRAQAFVVVSATEIRAESPPQDAGTVDLRVAAAGGTSRVVAADRFTYLPAPA